MGRRAFHARRACEMCIRDSVEVVRNSIKNIDDMLRFYELDFAIVDGVMPGDRYDSILLGTDHLCLIAAPTHPFARRASVTFDELTRQSLVLRPRGTGTRDLLEGYLLSHGRSVQDYRVVMEIDSVSAIKEIVANGLAVSIILSLIHILFPGSKAA